MVKKKRFMCGHVGFGQWCHRCAQSDDCDKKLKQESNKKVIEDLKAQITLLETVPTSKWNLAPAFRLGNKK